MHRVLQRNRYIQSLWSGMLNVCMGYMEIFPFYVQNEMMVLTMAGKKREAY